MMSHTPSCQPVALLIVDRDGVINHDSDDYIKSPQEWHAISASIKAIAQLNAAGVHVAMASNQAGVGRGILTQAALNAIHQHMQHYMAQENAHLDYLCYCTDPSPHNPRRKPNSGMLAEIYQWHVATCQHQGQSATALAQVLFVGDSYSDIQAAQQIGMLAALVKTGKGYRTLAQHRAALTHIPIYNDLADCIMQSFYS